MDPSTGLNLALCLLESAVGRGVMPVQVPPYVRGGMPGSLAPGALRDMGPSLGKTAFCACTHKRWPQAALAGPPLSMLFWAGLHQARCSGNLDRHELLRPHPYLHIQDASLSACRLFLFISMAAGSFSIFPFFLLQAASSF